MKITLFLAALTLALFASSCRTSTPIDPNTGEPSARCLPENLHPIYGTK